jgi:sodium transport system permease protein
MSFFMTVFKKEMRDTLRDRRTIMTVLLTSVLIGPIVLLLLSEFIGKLEKDAERRVITVDNIAAAPLLENFLLRQGMTIKAPPADYEKKLADGEFQQAVIRVEKDFSAQIARGENPSIKILYESTRTEAAPSIGAATELVRAFTRELGAQRLMAAGVPPQLAQPVDVQRIDLASVAAKGAQILFIIPMITLFGILGGTLSVAIDVTAGERERGSLEPLLTTPARRLGIVIGKWLTVTFYGWAIVALTLTGFWVSTYLIRSESLSSIMQFGPPQMATFALSLIPFAGLTSALLMLVATYGRTFKEAQTYAAYIMTLVSFVPLLSLFFKSKDQLWQLFIPIMSQQFVMERVVRGETLKAVDFIVPAAMALLLAGLFLFIQKRLLEQERIVFGRS